MQKEFLKLQKEKIKEFCIYNGIKIDKVISEFGSELNYKLQWLHEFLDLIIKNKV